MFTKKTYMSFLVKDPQGNIMADLPTFGEVALFCEKNYNFDLQVYRVYKSWEDNTIIREGLVASSHDGVLVNEWPKDEN